MSLRSLFSIQLLCSRFASKVPEWTWIDRVANALDSLRQIRETDLLIGFRCQQGILEVSYATILQFLALGQLRTVKLTVRKRPRCEVLPRV